MSESVFGVQRGNEVRRVSSKRLAFLGCVLALVPVFASSVAMGGESEPKVTVKDIISMFPQDTQAIVALDIPRIASLSSVEKSIQESPDYKEYQETIEAVGLDPKKDIQFAVIGLSNIGSEAKGAIVFTGTFDQEKTAAQLKMKSKGKFKEEKIEGVQAYIDDKSCIVFLGGSKVAAGDPNMVRTIVKINSKKIPGVAKKSKIMELVNNSNKKAMVWGVVALPPKLMQALGEHPLIQLVKPMKSVLFFMDNKNNTVDVEIKGMMPNASAAKKLVDVLQVSKTMASATAEDEDAKKLLKSVVMTSAADHVKISTSVSEEFLDRLSKKAKELK